MTLGLVYFRATDIRYLEAALFSIMWQEDLAKYVDEVLVFDNDTDDDPEKLAQILAFAQQAVGVPFRLVSCKHGDEAKRCHSWSVNECFRHMAPFAGSFANDWLLFTRSDYILDKTLVRRFVQVAMEQSKANPGCRWPGFVTSYAYHMAFDERGDQRIEGMRDIEPTDWRHRGAQVLLDEVNGWRVDSSNTDAGVWMTRRSLWQQVNGLNEALTSWGFQQTVFQQALVAAGAEIVQIPEYLFFHQHHGGTFRDYDVAKAELIKHWGPLERLSTFREVSKFTGQVCGELDEEPKP